MKKIENEFNPNVVKALMALRGETQEDLAKVLGCNRVHVNLILTRKRECTLEMAERIANHYKVERSIFFTRCVAE